MSEFVFLEVLSLGICRRVHFVSQLPIESIQSPTILPKDVVGPFTTQRALRGVPAEGSVPSLLFFVAGDAWDPLDRRAFAAWTLVSRHCGNKSQGISCCNPRRQVDKARCCSHQSDPPIAHSNTESDNPRRPAGHIAQDPKPAPARPSELGIPKS